MAKLLHCTASMQDKRQPSCPVLQREEVHKDKQNFTIIIDNYHLECTSRGNQLDKMHEILIALTCILIIFSIALDITWLR